MKIASYILLLGTSFILYGCANARVGPDGKPAIACAADKICFFSLRITIRVSTLYLARLVA